MSTQTRPDCNALPTIIEKWISGVQAQVALENAEAAGSPGFIHAVQQKIVHTLSTMREMVHGFDFARRSMLIIAAISWVTMISRITPFLFSGDFPNKTEASQTLGVKAIIDSDNYYDYLKIMARFV